MCLFFILKVRSGTDNFPFSFLRAMLNACLCAFFQSSRVRPAFCMCSLAICKDLLSLLRACTGNRLWGVRVWMRPAECLGCPWASCCILRNGITSGLCAGFLMEFMKWLVGSVSLCYVVFWALGAILSAPLWPSIVQFMTVFKGEMGLFGSILNN